MLHPGFRFAIHPWLPGCIGELLRVTLFSDCVKGTGKANAESPLPGSNLREGSR